MSLSNLQEMYLGQLTAINVLIRQKHHSPDNLFMVLVSISASAYLQHAQPLFQKYRSRGQPTEEAFMAAGCYYSNITA